MMTLVEEQKPKTRFDIERDANLFVDRTDITFCDIGGDRVRIGVTVHNTGFLRSQPTVMRLESAPLGAFVPWKPLTRMIVPAIDPGESLELTTIVQRPRPVPLGDFNGVPPRKLLEALSSPDQPSDPVRTAKSVGDMFRERIRDKNIPFPQLPPRGPRPVANPGDVFLKWLRNRLARQILSTVPSLAPDPMDLVNRGQPYWAGNLNVFIGNQSVERHMAKALRIYPGRTNLAMFVVGDSRLPDAYSFELIGLAPDWNTGVIASSRTLGLAINSSSRKIKQGEWVESRGDLLAFLHMSPPISCKAGKLEVHVTRRSDDKTAIVEFDLDPTAQGPGCYTV